MAMTAKQRKRVADGEKVKDGLSLNESVADGRGNGERPAAQANGSDDDGDCYCCFWYIDES